MAMLTTLSRFAVETALHEYVRSAAMPCPYARLVTRYLHLAVAVEGWEVEPALDRTLSDFYADSGQSILCILPQEQPQNYRAARAQAYHLRRQMHQLHLHVTGASAGKAEEVAARLHRRYQEWCDDLDSFLGPRVLVGPVDVMTTAFNPAYPTEHPRYAPHACMIVIRTRDLRAIHDRRPDLSRAIAVRSKCKLLRSLLQDVTGIAVEAMCEEYDHWLQILNFYRDFVTTHFTAGYRIDPRTLPQLHQTRRRCAEAMASDRFVASLVAFRAMAVKNPDVPILARILERNPNTTVFDIARIVFGDVSGMHVPYP
jgi:hypothetical protein